MADDGLLVNFTIEDAGILESQAVFRGGRWKDRLTAKKIAEHRRRKLHTEPSSTTGSNAVPITAKAIAATDDNSISNISRPLKRQKLNTDTSNAHPRQFVSSLFSSNPTSKPAQNQKKNSSDEIAASTVPSNAPLLDSIHTFTSLGLSPQLATHLLTKLSLRAPTAIQKSAISQLLAEDSDAFLQAETGSGKTLAYLLPIIQRIILLSPPLSTSTAQNDASSPQQQKQVCRASGLFAIILAPTRELCKQISTVLESLLRCVHWIVAGTVIGGEKKKSEKARLRKGVNILVATPGRLADHLDNTKALDVSNVRWLVLDEGDRLMELGFEEEIKAIVHKLEAQREKADKLPKTQENGMPNLPSRRTTVMCSATMKMNVQRLGEISLREAVHIKAEQSEDSQIIGKKNDNLEAKNGKESEFLAPAQLRQSFIVVPAKQRLVTLAALLRHTFARKGSVMKAIVFLSCADSVDFHFEVFAREPQAFESSNPPPLNRSPPQKKSSNVKDSSK
ncbi:ATP-dependent RNA helicase dbp7, partial [Peltigera leucophlebia]|nr:ATP-dependent RNA helicase dbp7 [Peltigera leucophlebia]